MENYLETTDLPLLAADFDYFRLPRDRWILMLTRLKQLGVTALMINTPWGFHEFNQGSVDLNGTTNGRRDLNGLLKLCSAFDLHCLLDTGPYNYQGVLEDGIPLWLLNNNDDLDTILSITIEGWYKALSKALSHFQWPDGPIVALQINSDPSEGKHPPYSKQLTEVKWRIWLRKHYDGIEALNEAYGTDYRTVNDVKFPPTWSDQNTPLEQDAKEFLEKVRRDTQTHYAQTLTDAGWQVPIYPVARELHPELPAIQSHSLHDLEGLSNLEMDKKIIVLHHPIQADPDPIEVGQTPTWANGAPIRMDGSLRRKFWIARQALWAQSLPNANIKGDILKANFTDTSLVTGSKDTALKLDIPPNTKPVACQLRLNGQLAVDNTLAVKRGKLSGVYLSEDEIDQTDMVLIITDPETPLNDFPRTYLITLLKIQAQALGHCAALAESLGQVLKSKPETGRERPPAHTLNTLEDARRGLQEADVALRKAITSISGLEEGFATILGKTEPEPPQPVTSTLTISPEIFDGPAQELLIEIGALCTQIIPQLKSAETTIRQIIEESDGLTVEEYQRGYETATTAAQTVRQLLLKVITRLRQEINAERLPLIVWRVHDQVQEIAETLRWGVLRG